MPRKKVLLVGSDPLFFEAPEHSFQVRGCDVFTATSGQEARAFLARHSVDLVLCDGAPSGVTANSIRQVLDEHVPVVVVAPPGDGGADVQPWRQLPDTHVIDRPVTGKAVLKLTRRLLNIADRKYISILVQVRVTEPKPTTIFGKSKDLAEGGLLVETNQTLTVHDRVVVSFLIPGADRMIQSDAFVVREAVRPEGPRRYGLKFIDIGAEDEAIIRAYLSGQSGATQD